MELSARALTLTAAVLAVSRSLRFDQDAHRLCIMSERDNLFFERRSWPYAVQKLILTSAAVTIRAGYIPRVLRTFRLAHQPSQQRKYTTC